MAYLEGNYVGYSEYAAWRSKMNGSISKLWRSHKTLHATLENLERLVHGHDENPPKIRTVCPRRIRSSDIEYQKTKRSEYVVAMVVGCAPALGKLSLRDLFDCFKDCDKPITMRHGNVDITGSRVVGGSPHQGMQDGDQRKAGGLTIQLALQIACHVRIRGTTRNQKVKK